MNKKFFVKLLSILLIGIVAIGITKTFRARTLFGRRPLQASGYPNGLSERNQGVLYEAERRW